MSKLRKHGEQLNTGSLKEDWRRAYYERIIKNFVEESSWAGVIWIDLREKENRGAAKRNA